MVARACVFDRATKTVEASRMQAIVRWLDLILQFPGKSKLGQALLAETAKPEDEDRRLQIITDWVAKKSTSTLTVRARSIAMFFKHCNSIGDEPAIPFSEESARNYVAMLRETMKPPTRAHTFLSSVSVCWNCSWLEGRRGGVCLTTCSRSSPSLFLAETGFETSPAIGHYCNPWFGVA